MSAHPPYQPRKAWTVALMLAALNLVNFLDKIVIGLVAVPMMQELGLTAVQFGVIGGAIYWLFAVSGVAGGFLANRLPTRWLLLAMALMWSVVQLPMIFTGSMTMIIIARVLLGVGEGPSAAISFHACYKWFPNDRRNLPATVIGMGASIGVLVAGVCMPLITQRWGWRANFAALGIVGVAWAAVWLLLGREGPLRDDGTGDQAQAAARTQRLPYLRLLTDSTVWGAAMLTFVSYWGVVIALTWMNTYLHKGLGYDAVSSGRMFALVVLMAMPVTLGVAAMSQRMMARGATSRRARVGLSALSLLTGGVLFALPQFSPLAPLAKVLVIAVGLGLSQVVFAIAPALVGEVVPVAQRGAVLAIEVAVGTLGGIVSPVVLGMFMDAPGATVASGYEAGVALSGALLITGAIVAWLMIDPERSKRLLLRIQPHAA